LFVSLQKEIKLIQQTPNNQLIMNQLLLGDNLEILRSMPDESVDLIYLDPPFFSNRTYEVIWGDKGEVRSFEDRFSGGIDHYIAWLKDRVSEMHRLLKPTGSLFLHCDWHADAYIRVYILDKLFGANNFRNCITWHYGQRTDTYKLHLSRKHDVIFVYGKSNEFILNKTSIAWDKKEFLQKRHDVMKDGDGDGREFVWTDGGKGKPRYKRFVDDILKEGKPLDDVWTIPLLNSAAKERIGYPTQKPEALLQRIVEMASNEGDTVLDPFVGGGTTVAVADKLGRKWVGIDQSVAAVKVTEMRLHKQQDLFSKPFTLRLHKYDYDTLRYKDAFEFETFIITAFGGKPQNKKGGDRGIDGKAATGAPVQVKRSDDVGVNVVKNFFVSAMQYDKTLYEQCKAANEPIGYIIAFSFGKGAIQEAARLRNEEGALIRLVRVDEIIPIAKKPTIITTLDDKGKNAKGLHEICFTAFGESEAGIEFYAWDWAHQPEQGFKAAVMMDKTGVQTQSFKAGIHHVAIKVVDNEGLESVEIFKLKINGGVSTL
jgi:DNA modification methylase